MIINNAAARGKAGGFAERGPNMLNHKELLSLENSFVRWQQSADFERARLQNIDRNLRSTPERLAAQREEEEDEAVSS